MNKILLSVDSLLFELLNDVVAVVNFNEFPFETFLRSTILLSEILPVVLRRFDKYKFKSDC
jgi:hypothetical protein